MKRGREPLPFSGPTIAVVVDPDGTLKQASVDYASLDIHAVGFKDTRLIENWCVPDLAQVCALPQQGEHQSMSVHVESDNEAQKIRTYANRLERRGLYWSMIERMRGAELAREFAPLSQWYNPREPPRLLQVNEFCKHHGDVDPSNFGRWLHDRRDGSPFSVRAVIMCVTGRPEDHEKQWCLPRRAKDYIRARVNELRRSGSSEFNFDAFSTISMVRVVFLHASHFQKGDSSGAGTENPRQKSVDTKSEEEDVEMSHADEHSSVPGTDERKEDVERAPTFYDTRTPNHHLTRVMHPESIPRGIPGYSQEKIVMKRFMNYTQGAETLEKVMYAAQRIGFNMDICRLLAYMVKQRIPGVSIRSRVKHILSNAASTRPGFLQPGMPNVRFEAPGFSAEIKWYTNSDVVQGNPDPSSTYQLCSESLFPTLSPLQEGYIRLYHGTSVRGAESILECGINMDFCDRSESTDFGACFYTTEDVRYAMHIATCCLLYVRIGEHQVHGCAVVVFDIPRGDLPSERPERVHLQNDDWVSTIEYHWSKPPFSESRRLMDDLKSERVIAVTGAISQQCDCTLPDPHERVARPTNTGYHHYPSPVSQWAFRNPSPFQKATVQVAILTLTPDEYNRLMPLS